VVWISLKAACGVESLCPNEGENTAQMNVLMSILFITSNPFGGNVQELWLWNGLIISARNVKGQDG